MRSFRLGPMIPSAFAPSRFQLLLPQLSQDRSLHSRYIAPSPRLHWRQRTSALAALASRQAGRSQQSAYIPASSQARVGGCGNQSGQLWLAGGQSQETAPDGILASFHRTPHCTGQLSMATLKHGSRIMLVALSVVRSLYNTIAKCKVQSANS